jgi:hypothetical protein
VAHVPLPADFSGTLNGVEYVIRVPASWNGTLLVYAHGSSPGAVAAVPPTSPGELGLEQELLSRGYALAGSFYEDSPEQASLQTLKLTRFFRSRVGRPDRTILQANATATSARLWPAFRYGGEARRCAPG